MVIKYDKAALVSPAELADFLGLPERTIGQWRYLSKGPKSIKVGRHVRYRWADIELWLDEQAGNAA